MAQSKVTEFGTLIIPGAYASITVEQSISGLATTGVLMIPGEADAGPDYSQEEDLSLNAFGPDQLSEVVAKYKSGPLVDAFRGASAAANDPQIQGSFSRAVLVKTNPSTKASATLVNWAAGSYGTLQDRSYGKLGNLIAREVVTKQAEVAPTTGSFAYLPAIASTNIDIRVNGGAASAITLAAQALPPAVKTQIDAVPGVDVDGAVDREILGTVGSPLAGNLALTVLSGNTVRVDLSVNFGVGGGTTAIGDTLWIPINSVIKGGADQNAGSYIVTAVAANQITARKLIDATGTPNQLTAPANVSSVAADDNTDVMTFSAMTVRLVTANPTDGLGKTLEINELTSGTGLLSYLAYTMGTAAPVAVTWISTAASPKVVVSATEYIAQLNASRQVDNLSEELSVGGGIALKLGYTGTTASAVVDATTLTLTVVGGSGASQTITLADYPSIADLAGYIATLTGYKAAAGTATLGSQPSTSLDKGTFTFGTTHGAYAGQIKQDAYRFYNLLASDGLLVEQDEQATAGLPAPLALGYMSGGTKGATTNATFNAAVDALELVRGNFLVPCFSRDAASDVADNLTDTGSSYTIESIRAYCRSHVLKMSTFKRRRNRQAFLSTKESFTAAKNTAANLASFRVSCTFQDVRDNGATGIVQYQPWMAAVKAAAMQAAAFRRSIMRKGINISAALQAAGDFNDQDDTKMEDALLAGLLPIKRDETGEFYWVSDQTTYGKDNNFSFNSVSTTYLSDVVALSTARIMDKAFVGQSPADVTASLGLTVLEAIMKDFFDLKLLAPSSDAPGGFKDAKVTINGNAMDVRANIKVAGAIAFVSIGFTVSMVTQSA